MIIFYITCQLFFTFFAVVILVYFNYFVVHQDLGQGHGNLKCFLPLCGVRYRAENYLGKHKVESEQDGIAVVISV